MTIEHNVLTDPELHEPKGAAAATAGQVYVADGAGSGAFADQAGIPSTVVAIETVADFPTAVANVITLAASTVYHINTIVDIGANRLVFSDGSILQGVHRTVCGITSSNSGALFTGTGVNMRFERLTLNAASSSKLFAFDGSGTKVFSARDILSVTHTGEIGTIISGLNIIMDFSVYFGGTDGITLSGADNGQLVVDYVSISGQTGTALDLDGSVVTGGAITNSSLGGTGGSDVSLAGAANSANIASGAKMYVERCNFTATTPIEDMTTADTQWAFNSCVGIGDTTINAHAYLSNNAVTTAIATINTPVVTDGGTGWLVNHDDQFTVTTAGRITYDGVDEIEANVAVTVSGTCVSSTHSYKFYIAKNGTVDVSTAGTREFASTADGSLTVLGIETLANGDYIELWVECTTGSVNFDLKDSNLVISKV